MIPNKVTKIVLWTFLLVVTGFVIYGLFHLPPSEPYEHERKYDPQPNTSGGIGMTYGGKIGIDLGGGLIMPMDGSGIGLGFGF